jgi:hypothetical protein
MTNYSVTLTVPDYIYDRARKIAEATSQPVEQVLQQHIVDALTEPLPELASDEQAELTALYQLSDDALWTIAREQMPIDAQSRMQELMDRNSMGRITEAERQELNVLVQRGQRLMLRKAEASAILTRRGHRVTPGRLAARGE